MTSLHSGAMAVLLVALLAACGGEDGAVASLFDVGDGRQLYLACEGQGSPTVVMEAGGAGHSGSWRFVQPEVADFTHVCVYDRAGTGRSSSVPPHPTIQAIAKDLRTLLAAARIDPPYVLVGHSLGGIIARQFATRYPAEVVGMVLVDTSQGGPRARFQAALTPEEWQRYPSPSHDGEFVVPEGVDLLGPDLVDIPLVVLSAGIWESHVPPDLAEKLDIVRLELQRELLDLSSNSTHVIADSDHAIPTNQPELVAGVISQVVEDVRSNRE
jgi:pimeloyl-ACP methyl ester carboxylesterase